MWQEIISIIEKNQRFVLTSHVNPDCDALGSELALAEHLITLGKEAAIINSDPLITAYRFLDPQHLIEQYDSKLYASTIEQAEVIIVLDASGGWERVGPIGEALEKAQAVKVCIDHHPDPVDFVDIAVVDVDAAAAGELIYDLIIEMDGPLSPTITQALYAAIMTDTGSFRFPKTSPRTHEIAADLLMAGADPLTIYGQIYEQNQLGAVQAKGHIMESIKTAVDGQIAFYGVSLETFRQYEIEAADLDGTASLGQQIKGVRVSIYCRELPHEQVKISLRSDGTVSINQVALSYGGGGHPSAAGATVDGKLDQVMADVLAKVEALMAAEKNA